MLKQDRHHDNGFLYYTDKDKRQTQDKDSNYRKRTPTGGGQLSQGLYNQRIICKL